MASCHLPLYLAATLICLVNLASANTFWNNLNCREATVTDGLCCKDDYCSDYNKASACNDQATCIWNDTNSTCIPNRDRLNNVCCKSNVEGTCHDIFQGICPSHFQVTEACCDPNNVLDSNVLLVNDTKVCCNTPCSDAKKLGCESPALCSANPNPWGRSLGGYGQGHAPAPIDLGFNPHYLPQLPTYGNVLPYNGFGNYHYQLPGKEHATVGEVQEITVDDLLHAMVEALSNDKDVFSYSSEIYSDPYFGKSKHGGPLGAFNLPDPNIFLRQEYGNPYGLSSGQFGFEGKGWPGVQGVYPGSGYGHLQSKHHYGYNPYQSSYGYNQHSYGYSPYQQSSHGYGYQSHGYGNSYASPYGGLGNRNPYQNQYGPYNQGYGSHNQGYGSYNQGYGSQNQGYGQNQGHDNNYGQANQDYSNDEQH